MKRKWLLAVMVVMFSLSLTSCFTLFFSTVERNEVVKRTRVVNWTFDPSLPPEKQSEIYFNMEIKTYNDIDISETFYTKKMLHMLPWAVIPAGVAKFTFDGWFTLSTGNTTTYYTVQDCSFQYNFEPGKKYYVTVGNELKEKGNLFKFAEYTYYARIYDYFPEFANGRISNKQYNANQKAVKSKDFDNHLLASIPIFETDLVVKAIEERRKQEYEDWKQERQEKKR